MGAAPVPFTERFVLKRHTESQDAQALQGRCTIVLGSEHGWHSWAYRDGRLDVHAAQQRRVTLQRLSTVCPRATCGRPECAGIGLARAYSARTCA